MVGFKRLINKISPQISDSSKGTCKFVPVHINFVSGQLHPGREIPRNSLQRRMDGLQKWLGRFKEEKNTSLEFNP